MKCVEINDILADLTLPRLRAGKFAALNSHVERCEDCRKLWERWLSHEEKLTQLLSEERAPTGFADGVMARIEEADSVKTGTPDIKLESSSLGLRRLWLVDPLDHPEKPDTSSDKLIMEAHRQLGGYFRGERAIFHLPVDLSGSTSFEREVLGAASEIPYGEVRSYKWVAERIGRPKAWRAVGGALHNNPLPILIPCHRVVKSDGGTGGYAFGEEWKNRLLTLERETSPVAGCSSTRIVCYRGCRYGRRVLEGNRVHFANIEDALDGGYRRCKVCQPA